MLKILKKTWPLLFLLGGIACVAQYFHQHADRLNTILHISFSFIALAAVLQCLYWYLNVRCWQGILWFSAHRKINFLQGFRHLALAVLGKYFPGHVWGMVARASIMQQQGVTLRQSIYATFYEQYFLLHASGIVCAALVCALQPSVYTAILAILAAASVALTVPLQRMVLGFLGRLSKNPQHRELHHASPLGFRQMLYLLAGYSAVWLAIGLLFCCLYFAFFVVTPDFATVIRLILANTVGITLGFFAFFSPGGLGVREAVTGGLLTSQMSLEDALVLTLVFRLWMVASEGMSGFTLLGSHKAGVQA